MRRELLYEDPYVSALHLEWWMQKLLRLVLVPANFLLWRLKVEGKENLPTDEGAMLCFNHTSYADAVISWAGLGRKVRLIGKSEIFDGPFPVGWVGASAYAFPVNRKSADRNAIRWAVASLSRGDLVGVYPEGTRVRTPDQPIVVHAGPALMAQMAGVCVVPIGIEGADRIWPKGRRFPRWGKVTMRVGKPIDPQDFTHLPKQGRNDAIMDAVMDEVYRLAGSSAPTSKDKQWR